MPTTPTPQQRYRDSLRNQGLRKVEIWVPDTKAPGFAEECRRQSAIVSTAANNPASDEAQMMRELGAHAAAVLGPEPDYDWGSAGPPK